MPTKRPTFEEVKAALLDIRDRLGKPLAVRIIHTVRATEVAAIKPKDFQKVLDLCKSYKENPPSPVEGRTEEHPFIYAATLEKARASLHSSVSDFPLHLTEARAIATAALEEYGDFDGALLRQFQEEGIWNDHSTVQAVLVAIRLLRGGHI